MVVGIESIGKMKGPILRVTRYTFFTRAHSALASPLRYCIRILAVALALCLFLIFLLEFIQRQQIVISIATNTSPCERHKNGPDDGPPLFGTTADESGFEEISVTMRPLCPVVPDGLGPVSPVLPPNVTEMLKSLDHALDNETESIIEKFVAENISDVRDGGFWEPSSCIPRYRTAIVIPYRDRLTHLFALQWRLHSLLQNQMIAYRLFVIEQEGDGVFNKGRLMNAAFLYIRDRYPNYDCIIFHDVDMIPEDDRNMYACTRRPKHLSPAVNEFRYRLPYKELVGGVFAISPTDFLLANGYSNSFWGWGGEDDDMYYRLSAQKLQIDRSSSDVGRYTMILHKKRKSAPRDYIHSLLSSSNTRYKTDGLTDLHSSGCSITSVESKPTYTHLLVDIGSRAPWEKRTGGGA